MQSISSGSSAWKLFKIALGSSAFFILHRFSGVNLLAPNSSWDYVSTLFCTLISLHTVSWNTQALLQGKEKIECNSEVLRVFAPVTRYEGLDPSYKNTAIEFPWSEVRKISAHLSYHSGYRFLSEIVVEKKDNSAIRFTVSNFAEYAETISERLADFLQSMQNR